MWKACDRNNKNKVGKYKNFLSNLVDIIKMIYVLETQSTALSTADV